MKQIYFAGGCFWGTEHFMKQIEGVVRTEVGYANSIVENPSYQQVCTGNTHAAETVKVEYDPAQVDLAFLMDLYFEMIDPTSLNQQGPDVGTQYRTGIYFVDAADEEIIREAVQRLANKYTEPVVVEVLPLENFFAAEDYHQDYLDKNPSGYCHVSRALIEMARNARKNKE